MKLPTDIEDKYLKEVLLNLSIDDLSNEEWKVIEGFENYMISNYGRIKSLERCVINAYGGKLNLPDRIKKLRAFRYFNKYVQKDFYNVRCELSLEGKTFGKSVARLVYCHFVEKFDMDDHKLLISYKDGNPFHVHAANLEKLSVSDVHYKTMKAGRAKKGNFDQAINQYTVAGNFVAFFKSIDVAADTLGTSRVNILDVIKKENLTAGEFRWFPKDYIPKKEDFIPIKKNRTDKVFNKALWKRLGQPEIDENNPPACMNLSLENLPDESWKPIPGAEDQFHISNKGRIKRLNTWTTHTKFRIFLQERIISLSADFYSDDIYYLHTNLNYKGKRINIRLNKYLYNCFVKEFDMSDRTFVVINQSDPLWDLDTIKLSLRHISSFF